MLINLLSKIKFTTLFIVLLFITQSCSHTLTAEELQAIKRKIVGQYGSFTTGHTVGCDLVKHLFTFKEDMTFTYRNFCYSDSNSILTPKGSGGKWNIINDSIISLTNAVNSTDFAGWSAVKTSDSTLKILNVQGIEPSFGTLTRDTASYR